MENLLTISKNFYYSQTYLALGILVGLALFLYFKPKEAFKIFGAIFVFVLIIYAFSLLGKSSSIGMSSQKKMINQTVDKMK